VAGVPQPGPAVAPPVPTAPPPGLRTESLPAPNPQVTLPRAASGAVRAALLVPLSGQSASVGQALLNAAQMALFDVSDPSFTLLPVDTKGTAEGAAAAAQTALSQGAEIILGPLFSPEVKAVTPVAQARGISILAFTTDRAAAQPGVYTIGILPHQQVGRILSFAFQQGVRRVGVLARNDEYGRIVVDAAKQATAASGLELAEVGYYDPAAQNLNQAIRAFTRFDQRKAQLASERRRLEAAGDTGGLKALESAEVAGDIGYDALLISDEGARLRSVGALLPYFGIETKRVKLLGTLLWEDPRLGSEPVFVGGWFPSVSSGRYGEFETRYTRLFGAKPPRVASLAYDATALAAVLGKQRPADFSQAALTQSAGFAGIDGIFRLKPDGTTERGFAVMEVTRTGARTIDPAPTTFQVVGQ
jgi:ABC-type branched-subunit amino acid transport system substrate-binding protein